LRGIIAAYTRQHQVSRCGAGLTPDKVTNFCPDLWLVEKYTMLVGDVYPYQFDLSSMITLKDNQIWLVGRTHYHSPSSNTAIASLIMAVT